MKPPFFIIKLFPSKNDLHNSFINDLCDPVDIKPHIFLPPSLITFSSESIFLAPFYTQFSQYTPVAKCQAPDTTTIKGWENDGISGDEYRGNLSASCQVGQGTLRWAGLVDKEYYSYLKPFNPVYWSGVDCSGFVRRTGEYATNWMSSQNIPLIFTSGIWIKNACMFFFSNTACANHGNSKNPIPLTIMDPLSGFVYIFGHGDIQGTTHVEQKIHRGDLVEYQHHISIVYCTPTDDPTGECAELTKGQYKIIHAYGMNCTVRTKNGVCPVGKFGRKVIVTPDNIYGLPDPVGYGRIILWK